MVKQRVNEDFNDHDSSTDSCGDGDTDVLKNNCPHLKRAININAIRKVLKTNGLLTFCKQCIGVRNNQDDKGEGDDIDVDADALWMCLKCGTQLCGRRKNRHALEHTQTPRSDAHTLAVCTTTCDIWCYECNAQIPPRSTKVLVELIEHIKKMLDLAVSAAQNHVALNTANVVADNVMNNIGNKLATDLQSMTDPLHAVASTAINNKNNQEKDFIGPIALPPPPPPQPVFGPKKSGIPVPCGRQQSKPTAVIANISKRRVRGLVNIGNTCFFNSVLQCLAQTPFLIDVLDEMSKAGQCCTLPGGVFEFDGKRLELPEIKGTLGTGGVITEALAETLKEIQQGGAAFAPRLIHEKFTSKCKNFANYHQHDAQELLRELLECVRSEDLRRYQRVVLENIGYENQRKSCVTDEMRVKCKIYGNQISENILRPDQVFRGFLVSTLICQECFNIKSCHEYFSDLSVPVSSEKPQPPNRRRASPERTNLLPSNGVSKSRLKRDRVRDRKAKKLLSKQATKQRRQKSFMAKDFNDENDGIDISNDPQAVTLQLAELIGGASASTDSTASTANVADTTPTMLCEKTGLLIPANHEQSDADIEDNLCDEISQWQQNTNGNKENNKSDDNGNNAEQMQKMNLESYNSLDKTGRDSLDDDDSGIAAGQEGEASNNGYESVNKNDIEQNCTMVTAALTENGATEICERVNRSSLLSDKTAANADNSNENLTESLKQLRMQSNGACNRRMRTSSYSDWAHTMAPRQYSEDNKVSVQSCLNNFTAIELMAGANKVHCENCTRRSKASDKTASVYTNSTKQLLISSPPAVLILHFKRFQPEDHHRFCKLNTHVDFPMVLDIAPYCASHIRDLHTVNYNQKKIIYSLYGIVEHSGTIMYGHYTAYVKVREPLSPNDKRWKFMPNITRPDLIKLDEEVKLHTAQDSDDMATSSGSSHNSSLSSCCDSTSPQTVTTTSGDDIDYSLKTNGCTINNNHDDEVNVDDVDVDVDDDDNDNDDCDGEGDDDDDDGDGAAATATAPDVNGCDDEAKDIETPTGIWYKISDSSVVEFSEAQIKHVQPYLLFYERIY